MNIFFTLFGAKIDEVLRAVVSDCSWCFTDESYMTHDHRVALVGALAHCVPANRTKSLRGGVHQGVRRGGL